MRYMRFVLTFLIALILGGWVTALAAGLASHIPYLPTLPSVAYAAPSRQDSPPAAALPATPPAVTVDAAAAITGTGIPSGTIIANRTTFTVTFFLEGQTYRLQALRSVGVALPRVTSVLALYNCEVSRPPDRAETECFWDPYLLQRDGFYEIVNGAAAGKPARLVLQSATAPPADQAWIHNRTGHEETVIYGDRLYEIPAGAVEEIPVQAQPAQVAYLRHCLTWKGETVCEWLPRVLAGGVYYALRESVTPVPMPNSHITLMVLERILPPEEKPSAAVATPRTPTATPTPAPSQLTCRLRVQALNVRSGPGLQYLILTAVRRADHPGGEVAVRGRNPAGTWLAVDERIAPGGWISGDRALVACDGDVMALPIAEITDGRLAPTPTPAPSPAVTPTPSQPVPPPGKALLIVHNAFGRDITFTISPDVWILKPGESITVVRDPGRVTFSASTPFHSGNAEVTLKEGETRALWLHFAPKTPGSQIYVLKY